MKRHRSAVSGLALTLALALLPAAAPAQQPTAPPNVLAPSAEQVRPLLVGAAVPRLALRTADGSPFDLNAALAAQPTVLVFYRGHW